MDQDHFITDMLRDVRKSSMVEVIISEDSNAIWTTMIVITLLLSKYQAAVIAEVKWSIRVTKTTVTIGKLAISVVRTSIGGTVTMLVALVMSILKPNRMPLIRLPFGAMSTIVRGGRESGIGVGIGMSKLPIKSRSLTGWGASIEGTIVGKRLRRLRHTTQSIPLPTLRMLGVIGVLIRYTIIICEGSDFGIDFIKDILTLRVKIIFNIVITQVCHLMCNVLTNLLVRGDVENAVRSFIASADNVIDRLRRWQSLKAVRQRLNVRVQELPRSCSCR
jgi:hypothetical protein